MYNNLLYFLTAVFLCSMAPVPKTPWLPVWASVSFFVLSLICYERLVCFIRRNAGSYSSAAYFRLERHASLLALFFFCLIINACDLKYYLSIFLWAKAFPSLVNVAGLSLFFLYLSLMWKTGRSDYQRIFGGKYSPAAFIFLNIRVNLPIILPWVLLSFVYDLFALSPWPALQALLLTAWGDFLFFVLFFFFVLLVFPPLVRRLWGCTRIPTGEFRDQLTLFCARQKFATELYFWPLFEGRVLTAGVMGFIPGLRYILITQGLIEALTLEELESVIVHEIGHVKEKHLLLYLVLISGFSLVIGQCTEPWTFFLLSRDFFYSLMYWSGLSPESLLVMFSTIPLLLIMLLYFRFLFGYFIRNFERQADLHVFPALGSSHALVSALEKIALLSGNIRDQPSWHHFGIGERVAFLNKCERDSQEREGHRRKIWVSLMLYLFAAAAVSILVRQMPVEGLARQYEEKYIEAVLWHKVQQEADKGLWLRMAGDLMQHKKMEKKALEAYERALTFKPVSPDLMNNLAWLLLTSGDRQLRDPPRALSLARSAVQSKPQGSFFDTLGLAYWANGFIEEAVKAEQEAVRDDPAGRDYYLKQVKLFQSMSYQQSLRRKQESEHQQGE
jgi:Zn-dependent protease with chaperone function